MEESICIIFEAFDFAFSFCLLVCYFPVILVFVIHRGLFIEIVLFFTLFSNIISFDNVTLETCICFPFDYSNSVVIYLLLLSNFVRMVNHNVRFDVELAHVERNILSLMKSLLHLLFEFIFQVVVDGVFEKILPLYSFSRINYYHLFEDVFYYCRNIINILGEDKRFIFYIRDQVNHIGSCIRSSS